MTMVKQVIFIEFLEFQGFFFGHPGTGMDTHLHFTHGEVSHEFDSANFHTMHKILQGLCT